MKRGDTIYFIRNRVIKKGIIAEKKANRVDVLYRANRYVRCYSFKLSETASSLEI